jgi:hypothetical protein
MRVVHVENAPGRRAQGRTQYTEIPPGPAQPPAKAADFAMETEANGEKRGANQPAVISQSLPAELLENGPEEKVGNRTSLADEKASISQYSWRSFRIGLRI